MGSNTLSWLAALPINMPIAFMDPSNPHWQIWQNMGLIFFVIFDSRCQSHNIVFMHKPYFATNESFYSVAIVKACSRSNVRQKQLLQSRWRLCFIIVSKWQSGKPLRFDFAGWKAPGVHCGRAAHWSKWISWAARLRLTVRNALRT